ncbi:MAG: hypothetical protein PHG83_02655 [Patescibacteria group bacterium]|jgi:hypothetical protein|nr:hypothetical protein [Patescibacteria group bacterium]
MNTNNQFELIQSEFKLTQQQMDKYDTLLYQIKTWVVTIWVALSSWSFQSKTKEILILSIFIVLTFWFLDAYNKNVRQDYKNRRDEIASALKIYFQTDTLPKDFVSPDLPEHKTIETIKHLFRPHVFLLYLTLIIISLLIYSFVF